MGVRGAFGGRGGAGWTVCDKGGTYEYTTLTIPPYQRALG